MERVPKSTNVTQVSTASHLGWQLTFTHNQSSESSSVSCTGNKEAVNGVPVSGNINASLNSGSASPANGPIGGGSLNSTVNFYGVPHDSALAQAVIEEMTSILNPSE